MRASGRITGMDWDGTFPSIQYTFTVGSRREHLGNASVSRSTSAAAYDFPPRDPLNFPAYEAPLFEITVGDTRAIRGTLRGLSEASALPRQHFVKA